MSRSTPHHLHNSGVICGLVAGAWLGAAAAPNKMVVLTGMSPFLISVSMVCGVFIARWTVPILLKGTAYVLADISQALHLLIWAILAGGLWAVANTLAMCAIRDVGLSIAFPLWNINSLVGIFWGSVLFGELRGSGFKTWSKVLGGATAVILGASLLAYASSHLQSHSLPNPPRGIISALGAALMWGTMYISYRKAYMSGMSPLSFLTLFIFGEVSSMLILASAFSGGIVPVYLGLQRAQGVLFWLFLGGFCWVVGEIFQQYAAKYIGIGRGIPLSNTNQLWGLAWAALVFGELSGDKPVLAAVAIGSLIMILGALAISFASAPESEQKSWRKAIIRECERYELELSRVEAVHHGDDPLGKVIHKRRWWDVVIILAAIGIFAWLAAIAKPSTVPVNLFWAWYLSLVTLGTLAGWVTLQKKPSA